MDGLGLKLPFFGAQGTALSTPKGPLAAARQKAIIVFTVT
jgi:hypothetical protein